MMNGSTLDSPTGIYRAPRRGHPRCAVPWFLSPHPSPTAIELRSADLSPPHSGPAKTTGSGLKSALLFCRNSLNSMPVPSPLPWGEGEPFSPRRTIQTRRLSTARCALFPLPKGEGQGEGKRRELPSRVSDHSRNCRTGRGLQQSRRFPQMTKKWNRGPCHEL